jgi:hypothetical protein
LAFFGRIVLGVLGKVSVRARFRDGGNRIWPVDRFQALQLLP